MKKKKKDSLESIPQLSLKGEDYGHIVPEHINIDMFLEFKDRSKARDEISNVKAFEKKDGELLIVNRMNDTIRYRYNLKELKKVFLVLGG